MPQKDLNASDKIREIKAIKENLKLTYMNILAEMAALDPTHPGALSTLRRVYATSSEKKASSFNYEEILLPIYNAVKSLEKKGKPKEEDPFETELRGYQAVIACQNEELDRLYEAKEMLENRITFLLDQIALKDKRMDAKDEIIRQLMTKFIVGGSHDES